MYRCNVYITTVKNRKIRSGRVVSFKRSSHVETFLPSTSCVSYRIHCAFSTSTHEFSGIFYVSLEFLK